MPLLGFQSQFAAPILAGSKTQTLRQPRKDGRDPKAGDTLYLYTGLRTKTCRKLGEARCTQAFYVFLSLASFRVVRGPRGALSAGPDALRITRCGVGLNRRQLLEFARRDGFNDPRGLANWFLRNHRTRLERGARLPLRVIRWASVQPAPSDEGGS